MLRCPELSNLSKSQHFTSILWRHQSPGSVSNLLGSRSANGFLDPSHPATKCNSRTFPQYKRKEIQVKLFPMALLERPATSIYPFRRSFLPWEERVKSAKDSGVLAIGTGRQPMLVWKDSGKPVGAEQVYPEHEQETLWRVRLPESRAIPPSAFLLKVAMEKAKRRVPMSFFTTTSKAKMGALRCTRRAITLRIKAALNLIVTKGAYYGSKENKNGGCIESTGEIKDFSVMKFDDEEARSMGRKWVLQGWSYVFSPMVEVYRMPYQKLIPILRYILTTLNTQAVEMENKWLATSLLHEQRLESQASRNDSKLQSSQTTRLFAENPSFARSANTPVSVTTEQSMTSTGRFRHPPVPITVPRKLCSTFDSASWMRDLESQLALLARRI